MAQDNSIPNKIWQMPSGIDGYIQGRQAQDAHDAAGRNAMIQDRQMKAMDRNEAEDAVKQLAPMIDAWQPGDVAGFEQIKQMGARLGVDPAILARYSINDGPMLKAKAGEYLAAGKQREIENTRADRAFGLDERRFAETSRHNRAVEARAAFEARQKAGRGGAVGARGEDASPVGGQSTVLVTDPYAQMSSPQQRDMLYRQESRAHDKISADARGAARIAAKSQAQMEQFHLLNQKTSTGPTYGLPIIGDVTKFAARTFNPDFANMEAITAAVAPAQRPPGSGPTSDYDAKQFERATVGVDKPGPANANIATAAIAQAQRDREYAQYVDWYFQKMRTNQGIDQAWQEYVESNPIFDQQDSVGFGLNKGAASWRQWFGVGSSASVRGAAAPPRGNILNEADAIVGIK